MKRLIVNADDFGLTCGVNAAIVELHRHGSLTSATLMAKAAATSDAIALAQARPRLGVGCHVVLVDGESVLEPRRDLLMLVDPSRAVGQFKPNLGSFLKNLYLDRKSISASSRHKLEAEIEAETYAQIKLLQGKLLQGQLLQNQLLQGKLLEGCGLELTHIDTHKHTHMFPRVLRSVLRGAKAAGIHTIRNPFEPAWSIDATPSAPLVRRAQVKVLRTMHTSFHRIVKEEGFSTTDGAIGVLATGTLDATTLSSLLDTMPDGTWELVTHPGYNDTQLAQAGTRLLASREIERQALLNARFPSDIELIHFGQLGPGQAGNRP